MDKKETLLKVVIFLVIAAVLVCLFKGNGVFIIIGMVFIMPAAAIRYIVVQRKRMKTGDADLEFKQCIHTYQPVGTKKVYHGVQQHSSRIVYRCTKCGHEVSK